MGRQDKNREKEGDAHEERNIISCPLTYCSFKAVIHFFGLQNILKCTSEKSKFSLGNPTNPSRDHSDYKTLPLHVMKLLYTETKS